MILDTANQQDYIIMSAMRGPDSTDYDPAPFGVKIITTAVLRYYAGVEPNQGAIIRDVVGAKSFWNTLDPDEHNRIRMYLAEQRHFVVHVREAFDVLIERTSGQACEDLLQYQVWLSKFVMPYSSVDYA